jgi:glyoxylase-like metal-dependent hydrolase (beta-lactamase superfamily II)
MRYANSPYNVGETTIVRIPECQIPFSPPSHLLTDWDEAVLEGRYHVIAPSEPTSLPGRLLTSVHTWLLRMNGRTLLIDTGIGNGKTRRQPYFDHLDNPYLERLAAASVTPDDVDAVLLTHIHTDHVGWNTQQKDGRWAPLFTRATYFIPQVGVDWFNSGAGRAAPNHDMFADSVSPVIEAGQAQMVPPDGGEILTGLRYIPTPGHSVDHMSVVLSSGGVFGVFAGDVMHSPVQIYRPDWNSCFCADPDGARRSRMRVLNLCADQGATYFSSHFPESSAGRITRSDEGFAWRFE